MELEGKIIMDLPMQSGTSKAGNPWKKKEWVLETLGTYPRKVKFHVFGDRAENLRFEVGKNYVVSFDLESREFNGRWYTDVSVFNMREADAQPMGMPQQAGYAQQPFGQQPAAPFGAQPAAQMPQPTDFAAGNDTEDLPF